MAKFRKSERLCSRKTIGKLFTSGNSLYHYPFRMVWLDSDTDKPYPANIAISVPSRRFRKAVTRNRLKRLIRESYRKHKGMLYEMLEMKDRKIEMMLIYISGTVYSYDFIDLKLGELVQKFIHADATGKEIL
jgi:ribonuclease P protein component